MHVRVCVDCGEEYRLDASVSVCADCGGSIESRDTADVAPPEPASPPSDVAYRLLHATDIASDLRPFAALLRDAAISFAVRPGARGFELWVPAPEVSRSREVLAPLLATSEADGTDLAFDPERGYLQCPACNVDLPSGAEECPGCGLVVAPSEPNGRPCCGAPEDGQRGTCPACGESSG